MTSNHLYVFLGTVLLLFSIAWSQTFGTKIAVYNQEQKCLPQSPINPSIKYGVEKQHDYKNAPFCEAHAKRTCCTDENLLQILQK